VRALDAAIGPRCAWQVWAAAYRRWPPAADRDRWPGSRGEEQAKYFRPGTWRLPGRGSASRSLTCSQKNRFAPSSVHPVRASTME
jgi:hypothetical protein